MWPFRRPPGIDPAQGDPVATGLRAAAGAGDWRAVSELLAGVEHPDDRAFHYGVLGDVPGVQDWVPQWVAAEPRSATPVLVAAQRYVAWGWEARTALLARYVDDEQFRVFHQRLQVAEDLLHMAVDLDGDDPAPWALLVTTARGLRLGQREARRRFGEAVIRYRWHLAAHRRLLQQLCPKWGGTFAHVRDLVGRTLAEMPDGCALGVLSADEHMEQWMALETGDHWYLRQPEILAELTAAADRSVRHPAYERRAGWPELANMFAWAFAHAGAWPAAAEQFAAIGDAVTEWPWGYDREATAAFDAARRAARRHARR